MLGSASLPTVDSILDLDVSTLLKPDYIQQHLKWSQSVHDALLHFRELCGDISNDLEGDQEADFENTLLIAAKHAKQLTAMRTRFEWLSLMSCLLQKHRGFFMNGGELYEPHETLRTGYTTAGFRRIVVSYSSFMSLIGGLSEEGLEETARVDFMVASHTWLLKEGWQLRLNDADPEFVAVSDPKFFASQSKGTPEGWRLQMLELNSDILDASKKVSFGSAGQQTEEARVAWQQLLNDLASFMELRSKVLANRPISKDPHRVEKTQVPGKLLDERGAPPVVMWCNALYPKGAQDQGRKKARHQEAVGPASWSSWSWSSW